MTATACAGWQTPAGADLRAHARGLASRKVLRFLDGASLPPFVAALEVYRRNPVCPPAEVALYTVSGWDPDSPPVPLSGGTRERDGAVSRYILEDASPLEWLRMLSNNPLCQASIAAGFHGPNAHLVGGGEAVRQALAAGAENLRREEAGLVIVVGFDPGPGELFRPPEQTTTRAAAIGLRPGDGPDPRHAVDPGASARTAVAACLEAAAVGTAG